MIDAQTAMLQELLPACRALAYRFAARVGRFDQAEDYAQEAVIVAWLSLRKPAESVLHARRRALVAAHGAVLDAARREDWMGRGERQKLKAVADAEREMPLAKACALAGMDIAELHALRRADAHGRAQRDAHDDELAERAAMSEAAPGADEGAARAQIMARLPAALAALTPRQREAAEGVLRGDSQATVAQRAGVTPSSVGLHLKAACKALRRLLHEPPKKPRADAAPPAVKPRRMGRDAALAERRLAAIRTRHAQEHGIQPEGQL